MQDLKDVTNNVHYENYRSKKLAAVTCNGVDGTKNKGQLTKYENSSVFSSMLNVEYVIEILNHLLLGSKLQTL